MCYVCYDDKETREQYERRDPLDGKPDVPTEKRCIHCQHPKRRQISNGQRRRLCFVCNSDPAIREQYASRQCGQPNEQTEEELNALIAYQYANLPDWWERCHPPDGEVEGILRRLAESVRRGQRRSRGTRRGTAIVGNGACT